MRLFLNCLLLPFHKRDIFHHRSKCLMWMFWMSRLRFLIGYTYILIYISIHVYIFCLTSSEKAKIQYRTGGFQPPPYKRGSYIGVMLSQMRSDKI